MGIRYIAIVLNIVVCVLCAIVNDGFFFMVGCICKLSELDYRISRQADGMDVRLIVNLYVFVNVNQMTFLNFS